MTRILTSDAPRRDADLQTLARAAKYRVVTVCGVCFALGATACSGAEGRERDEDTTTSGNQPGGSSYAPSGAGPLGVPADSEPLTGTGPNLVVMDNWVNRASNGVGIQGSFFTYQDG